MAMFILNTTTDWQPQELNHLVLNVNWALSQVEISNYIQELPNYGIDCSLHGGCTTYYD